MKKEKQSETEQEKQNPDSSEFQRFQNLTRKLVSVPKKEVDEQEAKREKNKRKVA